MRPDLFDGTFDNQALQRRERWREGRLVAFCLRENLPCRHPAMTGPWGHFPDLPANASAGIEPVDAADIETRTRVPNAA